MKDIHNSASQKQVCFTFPSSLFSVHPHVCVGAAHPNKTVGGILLGEVDSSSFYTGS